MRMRTFILLLLSAGATCGCKREASSTANSPQPIPERPAKIDSQYVLPPNPAPSSSPATPALTAQRDPNASAAAARPIQERLQGAIHAPLTVQLRMFIEKNGRVPDSFSEFVSAAMDSAPLAPDGIKFVIDPTDRTVKAVKK